MGNRKWLWISILFLFFVGLILVVGLWGSRGGILEFVKGQFEASPDLRDYAVADAHTSAQTIETRLVIDMDKPVHETAPEYLSFALDSSQIVGGKWWNPQADQVELGSGSLASPLFDFDRPLLDTLTRALSPAYQRIGGSEADKIYYDMSLDADRAEPPPGYHSVLTKKRWDAVNRFARRNHLKLVFTLNTGPSSRHADGSWNPENAETLLAYTRDMGYAVDAWELGNEVNLFWYVYGPAKQISADVYHQDMIKARKLVKTYFPQAMFSGQGSAFWPVLGEPLGFFYGFMADYLKASGQLVDFVSWHYYPQQSRRGLIASRRASPSRLLNPDYLDEVAYWGQKVQRLRDQYAPGKPIWLGETGNAQFGGEPGVSDRYIGGLWWLDELGLLAKIDHRVVVRQTLAGMNYGMIDPATLAPNPDFWNSYLWKHFMGQKVFEAHLADSNPHGKLRVYAHDYPGSENAFSLLMINLDPDSVFRVNSPAFEGKQITLYVVDGPDLFGREVHLNGKALEIDAGNLPIIDEFAENDRPSPIDINPLSSVFAVITK